MVKQFVAQVDRQKSQGYKGASQFNEFAFGGEKPVLNTQIQGQFKDWSEFYSAADSMAKQSHQEQKGFDLNLIDLDFLEGMGSNRT